LLVAAVAGVAYYAPQPDPAPLNASQTDPPSLEPMVETETGQMMLVPAGQFMFGAAKQHINLPAFYIDKTEVTNAMYARFCEARNRPLSRPIQAARTSKISLPDSSRCTACRKAPARSTRCT
jgi:formylglycine-generating enzyme required for sulfatase activity